VDVRQLRYFLAIVDEGTVHRAADALFVAQPSVTQTIRRLESELGSSLFHRQGRGLVLSPAGAALVEPAREVVRTLEVARAVVGAVGGLKAGILRIVSMPSQAVSPLTPLIARFVANYPGIEVAVMAADRPDDVRHALHRGAAEVGVIATAGGQHELSDLSAIALEEQRFIIVGAPGETMFQSDGPIPVAELTGLALIAGQRGTGMRRVADHITAVTDCRIAVEIEHREALLPLVVAGVGVAVVAESWRPLAAAVGLAVRELEVDETLSVSLVWSAPRLSPAASAFATLAEVDGSGPA
jgi:DNA-binding transcriptional LysR family regulator